MEAIINNFCIFFTWTFFIFYDTSYCIPLTTQSSSSSSSMPPLPPLLFPQDPHIFKIVPPNETALQILQKSEKSVRSSLFPRDRLYSEDPRREIFKISNMKADDIPEVFPSEFTANLKSEVEEYQSEDMTKPKVELEEQFRTVPANLQSSNEIYPEDIETHSISPKLNHGHITAILIAAIMIICVAIYAGLISWRSYLEKRYGMRERLVTTDDNEGRQYDV